MTNEADHRQIVAVLDRYAEALDSRRWALLDDVFAPDVEYDFGAWVVDSREKAVATIRSYLDGCGPTQHLLGNYRIDIDGDSAESRVYVRAFHLGAGEKASTTYEMIGEYRDELRRTDSGWRSVRRQGRVLAEIGSRSVLGSGAA